MSPSIVQQFGNMLSSRWSLGKHAPQSPKQKAIHEEVTYPRIRLAPDSNSCLNPSMSYEHVLVCGHVIATSRPDEPCAPNCHHIANERSLKRKKKDAPKKAKDLEFYCDACVEAENEALISKDITSTVAEHMRLEMRQIEADKRGKHKNFRQCYIGLKVTSIPCHSDGTVGGRYTPRTNHHPFDIAIPQTGENFFEDMLVNPTKELNPTSDSGADASASAFTDRTDVDSSPAYLGESGANFIRFAQSIAQKRENAASKAPSRPSQSNHPPSSVQNSDTALTVSPQRPRKRPIVIDEDEDYIDAPGDEDVVLRRPAKRHRKSTMTTPTASAAKKKTEQPMKFTYSTPVAPAAKPKTGRPTRKRS